MLLASTLVSAQETEGVKFKHEFGFDASRVLSGIFQTSNFNGLMYRYHTKKGSLRVRAIADFQHSPSQNNVSSTSYWVNGYLNTNTSTNARDKQYGLNTQLRIGWQWVKESKNVSVYLGEDAILGIMTSHSGRTDLTFSDNQFSTSETKNISTNNSNAYMYGASSVGGVIFKLNTRIRLTIETSIDIFVTTTKYKNEDTRSTTNKNASTTTSNVSNNNSSTNDSGFSMSFQPLSMLMLSVMF